MGADEANREREEKNMDNQECGARQDSSGQDQMGLPAVPGCPKGSVGGSTNKLERAKEVATALRHLHDAGWTWQKIGDAIGRSATAVGYVAQTKIGLFGEGMLQKLEEFLTNPEIATPPNPDPQKLEIPPPADGTGKGEEPEVDRTDKYPDGDQKRRYLKIAPALREKREALGIGREEMAKRIGVSRSFLGCFETINLPRLPSVRVLDVAEAEVMGRPLHRYCQKKFSKKMMANLLHHYRETTGVNTHRESMRRFKVGWKTIMKMEAGHECKQSTIAKVVEGMINDVGEVGFDHLVEMAKGGNGSVAAPAPVPMVSARAKTSPRESFAPMRIKFRLLRELPSVPVGAEWWWPPQGEWVTKIKDDSKVATNFLKTFTPEFMAANKDYFMILAIETSGE
jgi:transcriptional regulator with XRE-family HTH domain